jgi:hypothetical protein
MGVASYTTAFRSMSELEQLLAQLQAASGHSATCVPLEGPSAPTSFQGGSACELALAEPAGQAPTTQQQTQTLSDSCCRPQLGGPSQHLGAVATALHNTSTQPLALVPQAVNSPFMRPSTAYASSLPMGYVNQSVVQLRPAINLTPAVVPPACCIFIGGLPQGNTMHDLCVCITLTGENMMIVEDYFLLLRNDYFSGYRSNSTWP